MMWESAERPAYPGFHSIYKREQPTSEEFRYYNERNLNHWEFDNAEDRDRGETSPTGRHSYINVTPNTYLRPRPGGNGLLSDVKLPKYSSSSKWTDSSKSDCSSVRGNGGTGRSTRRGGRSVKRSYYLGRSVKLPENQRWSSSTATTVNSHDRSFMHRRRQPTNSHLFSSHVYQNEVGRRSVDYNWHMKTTSKKYPSYFISSPSTSQQNAGAQHQGINRGFDLFHNAAQQSPERLQIPRPQLWRPFHAAQYFQERPANNEMVHYYVNRAASIDSNFSDDSESECASPLPPFRAVCEGREKQSGLRVRKQDPWDLTEDPLTKKFVKKPIENPPLPPSPRETPPPPYVESNPNLYDAEQNSSQMRRVTKLSMERTRRKRLVVGGVVAVVLIAILIGLLVVLLRTVVHGVPLKGTLKIVDDWMTFETGGEDYRKFSKEFCRNIEESLTTNSANVSIYMGCTVNNMRNGSISINYTVQFDITSEDNETVVAKSANDDIIDAISVDGFLYKTYGPMEVVARLGPEESFPIPACQCENYANGYEFCLHEPDPKDSDVCQCASCKCSSGKVFGESCNMTAAGYDFTTCTGPYGALDGNYPDPSSCSFYYACGTGNNEQMPCPRETTFNPVTRDCDFDKDVMCVPPGITLH